MAASAHRLRGRGGKSGTEKLCELPQPHRLRGRGTAWQLAAPTRPPAWLDRVVASEWRSYVVSGAGSSARHRGARGIPGLRLVPWRQSPPFGGCLPTFALRALGPADVDAYAALRLRGLREAPAAFGSAYEEEAAFTTARWAERLRTEPGRFTLGAFPADGELAGVTTLLRERQAKTRHKAWIVGVYVAPEWRRQGVARALLDAAVARARALPGLEQILLAVGCDNEPARTLYLAAGFVPYGRELRALRVGDRYVNEESLVLHLRPAAAPGERTLTPTLLHEILATHMRENFEGPNANFSAILAVLRALTAAQASWRPAAGRNSIWEITQHLIDSRDWLIAILATPSGVAPPPWPSPAAGDADAWRATVERLTDANDRALRAIGDLSERRLLACPVPGLARCTFDLLIATCEHDAYHAGQLRMLQRLAANV